MKVLSLPTNSAPEPALADCRARIPRSHHAVGVRPWIRVRRHGPRRGSAESIPSHTPWTRNAWCGEENIPPLAHDNTQKGHSHSLASLAATGTAEYAAAGARYCTEPRGRAPLLDLPCAKLAVTCARRVRWEGGWQGRPIRKSSAAHITRPQTGIWGADECSNIVRTNAHAACRTGPELRRVRLLHAAPTTDGW